MQLFGIRRLASVLKRREEGRKGGAWFAWRKVLTEGGKGRREGKEEGRLLPSSEEEEGGDRMEREEKEEEEESACVWASWAKEDVVAGKEMEVGLLAERR